MCVRGHRALADSLDTQIKSLRFQRCPQLRLETIIYLISECLERRVCWMIYDDYLCPCLCRFRFRFASLSVGGSLEAEGLEFHTPNLCRTVG